MTLDLAITVLREIAIGERLACSLDYWEPGKISLSMKMVNPFTHYELSTQEIETVAEIVRRYNLAAIIGGDDDILMIADSFSGVEKVGKWLVKPSAI